MLIKAYAASKGGTGAGRWVTIDGTHVFIQGGVITKGPAKLIGSTREDLKGSGKSASDRKEELKSKYGDKLAKKKSESSQSKSTSSGASTSNTKSSTAKKDEGKASTNADSSTAKSSDTKTSASDRKAYLKEKYGDKLAERKAKGSQTETAKKTETKKEPNTKKTETAKKEPTATQAKVETFTVDGVKYEFKINREGEGVITKDGGTTLVGFNKSFKSVSDAKDVVIKSNASVSTYDKAKSIANQSGGVALYTGKVIMPGSVKPSGVDPKTRQVQYTATDHTGKTIKLDGRDMGAVFVSGLDMMTGGSTHSTRATSTKTSSKPKSSGAFPSTISQNSKPFKKVTGRVNPKY